MINTIILGHALNILPKMPSESVNCVVTSPPFWGLRDYGTEPVIWDGDKNCQHQWIKDKVAGDIRFRGQDSIVGNNANLDIYPIKHRPNETNPGKEGWHKNKGGLSKNPSQSNFCSLCNAWRGSLGLEPTFDLYIKHLCDIFDEIKRVLRKDGVCFVNIGDTYGGSMQGWGASKPSETGFQKPAGIDERYFKGKPPMANIMPKSLLDIPYRFSIEMTNRDWIKRNTIIWWKPNCMPASAKDRFTVDFEYLFFFSKSNKTLFWTNEKTLECVGKQPLGIKGIKGKDWEWRKCPTCWGKGTIIGKALKERGCSEIGVVDKNTKALIVCHRCKGSGKIKYSFWTGHDYWFEQQFEEYSENSDMDTRKTLRIGRKNEVSDPHVHREPSMYNKLALPNPQGRNKRCVWIIPTQPFPEAHFAVYPEELIEIPIKAGCPEFVCKKCGKARVKIYKNETTFHSGSGKSGNIPKGKWEGKEQQISGDYDIRMGPKLSRKEIGYTDCGCNAGWESGIILDLFMGAGTTALVALKQRKRFIGIEIKQEYIDMSYRRIANVQQKIF